MTSLRILSLLLAFNSFQIEILRAEEPLPALKSVALMEKWIAGLDNSDHFSPLILKELNATDTEIKKKAILEYSNHLLKNFSSLTGMAREDHYNAFLKTANHLVPEAKICSYFYDCYSKNIVNLNGLNVLFEHYNRRKKHPNRFSSSKAIDASALVNELNDMEKESFTGEKSLLVRQRGEKSKHVTPVLIRKTASETQFILLDSLGSGSDSAYDWSAVTEVDIRNSNLPNIRVHKFSLKRQNDGRSCPIFAFKDALQNTKTNLFDQIDACTQEGLQAGFDSDLKENSLQIIPDCTYPNSYTMNSILPHFMKMAQNVQMVEEYLKKNPAYSNTPVSSRGTLSEITTLHKDAKGSTYARKHAYKYYGIILGDILGETQGGKNQENHGRKSAMVEELRGKDEWVLAHVSRHHGGVQALSAP